MKESENSRNLLRKEKLLMLEDLIVPEFLEEGKMISDENLLFVKQLLEKAEMVAISAMDLEVERFFKWVMERFDDQVIKNKGGMAFRVVIFIWYDEVDNHVKVKTTGDYEKKVTFVVDKRGYAEGNAIVNKTLKMIDILKNFDLTSSGQEGDYKGCPYKLREIIMHL